MNFFKHLWRSAGPLGRQIARAEAQQLAVHVVGDVAHVVDQKTGAPIASILVHSILPAQTDMAAQANAAMGEKSPEGQLVGVLSMHANESLQKDGAVKCLLSIIGERDQLRAALENK